MDSFKNLITRCAVLYCLFMIAGLQGLHKPTQQPILPKLYEKKKPQTPKIFEDISSLPAAKIEAETQTLKAQKSKQCYDLMMIIDSTEEEQNDGKPEGLTYNFFSALFQEDFPIIVSHNIVHNLCSEMIRSRKIFPSESIHLVPSSINLKKWFCYDFPSAKLMLFIPIKYLAKFSIAGTNIGPSLRNYGFETKDLISINSDSPSEFISIIEKNQKSSSPATPIVEAVQSMLRIPNKPNSPTWNIYLTGHGHTAIFIAGLKNNDFFKLLKVFQNIKCSYLHYDSCYSGGFNRNLVQNQLAQLKVDFIVSAQGINETSSREGSTKIAVPLSNRPFYIYQQQKKYTNFFAAAESFFGNPNKFVQKNRLSKPLLKDPIAQIIDTVIEKESKGKSILNHNQPFVYIPAVGVFNAITVDKSVKIITKSIAKAYAFENKTIEFVDPAIKTIIVYPDYIKAPIHIKSDVAIASPMQPSKEYKPKSADKYNVMFIKPPLKINFDKSITATIQKTLEDPKNYTIAALTFDGGIMHNHEKDVHIFEKISYEGTLSSLIPNFAKLNKKRKTTLFVIKKLECFDYQNSNLGNNHNNLRGWHS